VGLGLELASDRGEVHADVVRLLLVLRSPDLLEQMEVVPVPPDDALRGELDAMG
jgi:hypothetical protein